MADNSVQQRKALVHLACDLVRRRTAESMFSSNLTKSTQKTKCELIANILNKDGGLGKDYIKYILQKKNHDLLQTKAGSLGIKTKKTIAQ